MGTYCQYRIERKGEENSFGGDILEQSYALYGWLIDCRNYAGVPPLQKGEDVIEIKGEYDDESVFAHVFEAKVLLDFDYDQLVEDRRTSIRTGLYNYSGAHTCEPGKGVTMTYREFLPGFWFEILASLKPDDKFVIWTF